MSAYFVTGTGTNVGKTFVAAGLAILLVRHTHRPLAVVPDSPLGRGQGLYLLLLSIMVIGNFEKAIVGFADQRLITEGVIKARQKKGVSRGRARARIAQRSYGHRKGAGKRKGAAAEIPDLNKTRLQAESAANDHCCYDEDNEEVRRI